MGVTFKTYQSQELNCSISLVLNTSESNAFTTAQHDAKALCLLTPMSLEGDPLHSAYRK